MNHYLGSRTIEPYLNTCNSVITKGNKEFTQLTGFEMEELLGKSLVDIGDMLKINSQILIENIDDNYSGFIFTKLLEAREVDISLSHNKETNEKEYIFMEKPNSRLDDKLIFIEQTFKDNIVGASIYSVPDLILLKANQCYIDRFNSAYNNVGICIGRHIGEIIPRYVGSKFEMAWNTTLQTQKPYFEKEYKLESAVEGTTYWDAAQMPIFHNGEMKYIFKTHTNVTKRVIGKQQIEQQNELLKRQADLLNLSKEAIFAWDLNGGIVYWNRGAEQMYGYCNEEACGCVSRKLLKTVYPININDIKSILDRDGFWNGEIEHICKDGRKLIIETTHQVILNELGQKVVLETNRDITEQVKTNKGLKDQKDQLEAIIENMPDALAFYNKEGKIILLNAEGRKLHPKINIGKTVSEVHEGAQYFDLDNNILFLENLPTRRVFKGEKIRNEKIIIKRPDKSVIIEINGTPVFDEEHNLISAVVSHRDITESFQNMRKIQDQQEQILKSEKVKKEQLEAVIENIEDAIIIYDKDNNHYLENRAAREFYPRPALKKAGGGYEGVEFMDMEDNEITWEDMAISRVLRGEVVIDQRVKMVYKDNIRYLSDNGRRVNDADGKFSFTIFFSRDITGHINSKKTLFEAKEVAEKANEAKSLFLANMSHEIRTPMNGIVTNIQLLETTNLDLEQNDYMKMLRESMKLLTVIINDLLDISKIESGTVKLNNEPFDLRKTINDLYKSLLSAGNAKALEISYYLDPLINFKVMGDEVKLKQIINNLISNAVKFTEVGFISFRVIRVNSDNNCERIEFKLKDTGIGIDESLKEKIFGDFYQGDLSSKKKYMGTGLGLAISKQLALLMNAEIEFESKVGVGTTFYFVCDFEKVDNKDETIYTKENSKDIAGVKAPKHNSTVLYVEDNIISQQVIERLIVKMGYEFIGAHNATNALEALKNNKIDLVLMDIQLPELNGYELTKIIRNDECGGTHIPIIAITAYAMREDRDKCIKAGMDDYMSKPIDINNFNDIIVSYLQEK